MSSPGKPEVTPTAPPAPQPSLRRPPPGAMALPGMVAPGGHGTNTINVMSPAIEAEIKAAEQREMTASAMHPKPEAPVPQPRATVRGRPAGAMALPGMVASSSTNGGEAIVSYLPVNDEKRPPVAAVEAAVIELAAAAAITAAVSEHAASQMAPELVSRPSGTAAGNQQFYEAPPSYAETVQPGGYPQPQPGYNPQSGYQPYPPQQGYPPQAAYPQAGGPQGSHAAGGYQAPPIPQQQVPAKPGMEPEDVCYGATASAAYPHSITAQPQPTETTPAIVMTSSGQHSSRQLPVKTKDWDKGLCSCCSSCGLCLLSWFCPCYMVGKNAEALGHSCCLYGVGSVIPIIRCITQVILRTEIRNQHGIKGSEFGDFCYVCFCSVCALTQEANELRVMATQEIQRE